MRTWRPSIRTNILSDNDNNHTNINDEHDNSHNITDDNDNGNKNDSDDVDGNSSSNGDSSSNSDSNTTSTGLMNEACLQCLAWSACKDLKSASRGNKRKRHPSV